MYIKEPEPLRTCIETYDMKIWSKSALSSGVAFVDSAAQSGAEILDMA